MEIFDRKLFRAILANAFPLSEYDIYRELEINKNVAREKLTTKHMRSIKTRCVALWETFSLSLSRLYDDELCYSCPYAR